jgi:hypothetical protein
VAADFPLTTQQEVFLSWMYAGPRARHPAPMTVALRVDEDLDTTAFEGALGDVAARHEALRTVFHGREATVQEESVLDATFTGGILTLSVHHLVSDAWSMGVLLRDLGIAYSARLTGRPSRYLARPVTQASDAARRSRERWTVNRKWWEDELDGAPAALTHFPGRRPSTVLEPRAYVFTLDSDTGAAPATPYLLTLAAWVSVLSSRSGATEIVLMSPSNGRNDPSTQDTIGCLFVPLLLRVDLSGTPDLRDLLRRVRVTANRATEAEDYPYHEFQTRFPHAPVVAYHREAPASLPGVASTPVELESPLVDDLEIPGLDQGVPQLTVYDDGSGPSTARLAYNAAAFDDATVQELAEELRTMMRQVSR